MKKWLFIFALAAAGHFAYQKGLISWPKDGAFDESGQPIARVFVAPGCGALCEDVESLFRSRRVAFDRVDLSEPGAESHGIRGYPVTLVGAQRIDGNQLDFIVSALAENFGPEVLTSSEQIAMRNHFDEQGKPVVVLYGTDWCPYCKKQKEFFEANGIDYYEINVEKSNAGRMAYDILHGGGYPLTYVGYRRFNGYKEHEIKDALRELL